jgi:hypothetical protein
MLLTASAASAQSAAPSATLQLSLDEAVRRALENNPDLAAVRLGAQIEAERVSESESAYVPVFSTIVGTSSNVTPPSNFLLGERGVDTRDVFTSTGVRQRLPWSAGTWNISWDTSRTATDNPLSSFDPSLQSGFQVAFSQPLLRDRKMDLARQQTIVSRRNLESSSPHSRVGGADGRRRQAGMLDAEGDARERDGQQRSLELAEELVRQNKARVEVGQTPPLDLLQSERRLHSDART